MRFLLALVLCCSVSDASGGIIATHIGSVGPSAEGWQRAHFNGEDLVLGSHLGSIEENSIMDDMGYNSWEIIDNGSGFDNGGYSVVLSPEQEAEAIARGFVMTATVRSLENSAPNGARVFVFGTSEASSDERWVLSFGADASGDPSVSVQGGDTATLAGASAGYHTFQLKLDPAVSSLATVSIDGVEVLTDQPSVPAKGNKPRFVYFGSWSNLSVGGARYFFVEFETLPPALPGDFDGNGRVDAFDFLRWQRDPNVGLLSDWEDNYGAPQLPGDFDRNGRVDAKDFLRWQRNPGVGLLSDWEDNYGAPLATSLALAPEPTSLALLGLCSAATLCCRRR